MPPKNIAIITSCIQIFWRLHTCLRFVQAVWLLYLLVVYKGLTHASTFDFIMSFPSTLGQALRCTHWFQWGLITTFKTFLLPLTLTCLASRNPIIKSQYFYASVASPHLTHLFGFLLFFSLLVLIINQQHCCCFRISLLTIIHRLVSRGDSEITALTLT